MQILWAEQALTETGWKSEVRIEIEPDGRIGQIASGQKPEGRHCGILLPAPANLHSHAFQRAMAGMTERRGDDPRDTFWTWRKLMYRFLAQLTPDDIEAISAFVQMEMLEAGYAAIAEFHYLHHQPDGKPYAALAETSARIAAAAAETGIGLTLLPVFYEQGGCDGRKLGPGQVRFGNNFDRFAELYAGAGRALKALPADSVTGVALHSLRAVSRPGIGQAVDLAPHAPLHIHVAEQEAEILEVRQAWGQRPVAWLLANHAPDARWCLVHATHMEPSETENLAKSGAVVGLCPITEANLGDGIFDGARYLAAGGRFGIGSDSNIRIALAEELRLLEYSQRLRDKARAVLAAAEISTGRMLFEGAAKGGALAAGRACGSIATGRLADLVALDAGATNLLGCRGDDILDSYIFAADDRMVSDVWSAGRHVVTEGRHRKRAQIEARYRKTLLAMRARI